jgi:hypothetical protein
MSKLFVVLMGASLVALLYYMHVDYEDAMAKCQIKFSYDTCFHSLNR